MERGSSKHGPRLDEQMEHEVRGLLQGQPGNDRVEEWHDPEPAGEDQPEAAGFPAPELDRPGGAPAGITVEETERRAEFASYLHRSLFPAKRSKLRRAAQEANAPDWVVAVIDQLPDGEYPNVAEAWAAAGGGIESQRW
ncbi:MAG: DUF2795 domain-containing protein [Actinobacteria bacterium]|nr:MAG: DUF2795 domain-containing protein [Actinomycetota bacterium]